MAVSLTKTRPRKMKAKDNEKQNKQVVSKTGKEIIIISQVTNELFNYRKHYKKKTKCFEPGAFCVWRSNEWNDIYLFYFVVLEYFAA